MSTDDVIAPRGERRERLAQLHAELGQAPPPSDRLRLRAALMEIESEPSESCTLGEVLRDVDARREADRVRAHADRLDRDHAQLLADIAHATWAGPDWSFDRTAIFEKRKAVRP